MLEIRIKPCLGTGLGAGGGKSHPNGDEFFLLLSIFPYAEAIAVVHDYTLVYGVLTVSSDF